VLETVRVPPPMPPGARPTRTPLPLIPEVVMLPPSKLRVAELSVQMPKLPRPEVVMVTLRAEREEPVPKLASPWLPPPEVETLAVLIVMWPVETAKAPCAEAPVVERVTLVAEIEPPLSEKSADADSPTPVVLNV
jgi:hypothetical protein